MIIIFIGAPGSGKGTQAKQLQADRGLTHIATGDLFREHLNHHTALGEQARAYMKRGELVPDEITIEMVRERLNRGDITAGVIFDGFPRTIAQADALAALLKEKGEQIHAVLHFKVSDDEIVRRLSGRIMCRKCNLAFHKESNPFTKCPYNQCSGEYLYQREDDQPEVIRSRLNTYNTQTKPLLAYYEERGLLVNIPGEGSVEEVTRAVLDALDRVETSQRAARRAD